MKFMILATQGVSCKKMPVRWRSWGKEKCCYKMIHSLMTSNLGVWITGTHKHKDFRCIWMSHWHQQMVDGAEFWIDCKWLKALRKASQSQLIKCSAPSTICWCQCDFEIMKSIKFFATLCIAVLCQTIVWVTATWQPHPFPTPYCQFPGIKLQYCIISRIWKLP